MRPIFCHAFCADTLLAHCHPRSCGGKELKPTLKQKDMPKNQRFLKNSTASQKLNLSDRSLPTDKKAFQQDRKSNNKNDKDTMNTGFRDRTTGGNTTYQ